MNNVRRDLFRRFAVLLTVSLCINNFCPVYGNELPREDALEFSVAETSGVTFEAEEIGINSSDTEIGRASLSVKDGILPEGEILKDSGKCGDDIYYTFSEDFNEDGILRIVGTGVTYNYGDNWSAKNPYPWLKYESDIDAVYISSEVTRIGINLFCYTSPERFYYGGSREDWAKIDVARGNYWLQKAEEDEEIVYQVEDVQYYTVTFDPLDGREPDTDSALLGCYTAAYMPDVEGYRLEGWYLDKEFTERFYGYADKDMTVYAKWYKLFKGEANYYVDGVLYKQLSVYEDKLIPHIEVEEKPGFIFSGWYTDEPYVWRLDNKARMTSKKINLYGRYLDAKSIDRYRLTSEITIDGKKKALSIEYDYSAHLPYDTRKHLPNTGDCQDDEKQVYDLYVNNFAVRLDGEIIEGISVNKILVTDNVEPYGYNKNATFTGMQIKLKLSYDTKGHPELAKLYKKLKPVLNAMAAPKRKLIRYSDSIYKNYDYKYRPAIVEIQPITVSANTPVYTTEQVKANPELEKVNGAFVYSGETRTKWYYVSSHDSHYSDLELKGLTYQFEVKLSDGSTVMKHIKLKPGKLKFMRGREGGESYVELELMPVNCDYYVDWDDLYEGSETAEVIFSNKFAGSFPRFKRSEKDVLNDEKHFKRFQ